MTCPDRREALLDLSLGLLEPGEARALEAHVAGCQACRDELRSFRAARGAMAQLPVAPAPLHGEALLLAAARQAADEARRRRPAWRRPWLAGGTLGLAGAAALALVLVQSHGEPRLAEAPRQAEGSHAEAPEAPVAAPAAAPAERKQERGGAAQGVAGRAASPGSVAANRSADVVPSAAAPAAPPAEQATVASAPPPAPARAAAPGPRPLAAAEDVGPSATGVAAAPAAASLRAASPEARAAKAAAAGCRLEARRSLDRDETGRVVARHRVGRYPGAGGPDLPLSVDERFAPGGRLRSAVVRIGDRTITVSDADVAAGRLEPWPGVILAADAGEAERTPPRCEP